MWPIALVAILACAQGRAVNISNTWVLPEEGFPVFYRYFRDRISWYEADAVCQFHHANLVTVDTTAQYDAVRAYLKELDISTAVWVGLIRSNPDGDFTWTDYRGLSGEGYWSAAPDSRAAPLCAAADPSADYRWEARACGGPTVASFICELPVPQWALGAEGCMVRALPDLTVLYLPESAAVQLTTDCGIDGIKRVLCTGNVKHEELLKNLSCSDETETEVEETFTSVAINNSISSTPWTTTVETSYTEQDVTNKSAAVYESVIARNNFTSSVLGTLVPIIPIADEKQNKNIINLHETENKNSFNSKHYSVLNLTGYDNNMLLDQTKNNLQNNDVPKHLIENDLSMSDNIDELEDEQHMRHKILHDELARHGNFETIFNQPSDHFIPPLVMAKAKMSDDMTVLSLEQKHAQQIAEQQNANHKNRISDLNSEIKYLNKNSDHAKDKNESSNGILKTSTQSMGLILNSLHSRTSNNIAEDVVADSLEMKVNKFSLPKKYKGKKDTLKDKEKVIDAITKKRTEKVMNNDSSEELKSRIIVRDNTFPQNYKKNDSDDDVSIDLKVIFKTPEETEVYVFNNQSKSSTHYETLQNDSYIENGTIDSIKVNGEKVDNETKSSVTFYDHIIKITIPSKNQETTPLTFEVTTKIPRIDLSTPDSKKNISSFTSDSITSTEEPLKITVFSKHTSQSIANTTFVSLSKNLSLINLERNHSNEILNSVTLHPTGTYIAEDITPNNLKTIYPANLDAINTSELSRVNEDVFTNDTKSWHFNNASLEYSTAEKVINVTSDNTTDFNSELLNGTNVFESTTSNASEATEDFQSPLLSGANDPVPKPNRSRRPLTPPNRNKFNPFRILG